jgi:hypothetical protein
VIAFENPAGETRWNINLALSNGGKPGFHIAETAVANARLMIREGGNVGIGIDDPGGRLHVYGEDGEAATQFVLRTDGKVRIGGNDLHDSEMLHIAVPDTLNNGMTIDGGTVRGLKIAPSSQDYSGTRTGLEIDVTNNINTPIGIHVNVNGYASGNQVAYGLHAKNLFGGQYGYAVKGYAEGANSNRGVFGHGHSDVNYSYGVYGYATGNATYRRGVHASAGGSYASGHYGVYCHGNMYVTGRITEAGSVSDRAAKKNMKPFSNALDKVMQLKPITFDYRTSGAAVKGLNLPAGKRHGFVAQEVQEVLPELTKTIPIYEEENEDFGAVASPGPPQTRELLGLDYKELIPLLTSAIQEQQQQIEGLQRTIESLSGASPGESMAGAPPTYAAAYDVQGGPDMADAAHVRLDWVDEIMSRSPSLRRYAGAAEDDFPELVGQLRAIEAMRKGGAAGPSPSPTAAPVA